MGLGGIEQSASPAERTGAPLSSPQLRSIATKPKAASTGAERDLILPVRSISPVQSQLGWSGQKWA